MDSVNAGNFSAFAFKSKGKAMEIKKLKPLSEFSTNSYLVITNKGNAALIDAPSDPDVILDFAQKNGAVITDVLLTHGHLDHISAAAEIQNKTNCNIYIHSLDAKKFSDPSGNLSGFFGFGAVEIPRSIKEIEDGDVIRVDEIEFKVLHTPGHSSGSVCYICGDVIFSGDTLFNLSIGRTDMPDGNYRLLCQSLQKLKNIEGRFTVYPGHMESTTLDFEKNNNPYMM